MGIPSRNLPPHVRDAVGLKIGPGGLAAPSLGPPLVGHVLLELAIHPPTATHQAKQITTRGGRRQFVDTDVLAAARRLYALAIPDRPGPYVAPLAPPVVLRATFTFAGDPAEPATWHVDKPDLVNQIKLLEDVLAARGYVADDKQISLEVLAKRVAPAAGVRVYLRTLLSAEDVGEEYPVPAGDRGRIVPLVAAVQMEAALGRQGLAAALGERPIGNRGGGTQVNRPTRRKEADRG